VKAIGEMPRIRPPEPVFTAPPEYQRTTYQQGTYGRTAPRPGATQPIAAPPPPLQSRTGKALKWTVSALLIAALGLGSWQLADALMDRNNSDDPGNSETSDGGDKNKPKPTQPIKITSGQEYVLEGGPQDLEGVPNTYDGDDSTYWRSKSFIEGPKLAPYKAGVGIVYDLGKEQDVSAASLGLRYAGDHTTVELYAAKSMSSSTPPSSMKKIGTVTTSGKSAKIKAKKPVATRYVLVWLTDVPSSPRDEFSGAGYKQAITDVKFTG